MQNNLSFFANVRWGKALQLPLRLIWQVVTWFFRYPPSLSYAKVSTYLSCPLKYKFQYVDRVPMRSSPHLSFGSSLHKVLEEFHKNCEVQTASEKELLWFLEKFWISDGYASPQEEEEYRNKAKEILRRYLNDNRHAVAQPKYFEKLVEDKIGPFPFQGRFDRVDKRTDGKLDVIDYKSGKTLDARQLKRELQAKIYTLLSRRIWGKKFGQIFFYYLETGKKVPVEFTSEELGQTVETIKEVGRSIYRKVFPAQPSALCSWCDYQSICPAWENRPSSKKLFRLSYSKMMSYKLCPRSYKSLYIDRTPPQPRSFFSIGISVHNALEEFYKYEGYLKEPSLKWLLHLLEKNWVSAGYASPEEEKKFYAEAEAMLKVYYRDWIKGKFKKAFACEPYFELPIGEEFVTIGYIDRIDQLEDGTYEVIDYKTEPKIRTQQEVDEDLQLTIYYWACIKNLGITPSKVSLHFLRHNKKLSTTRSQKDIDQLIEFVKQLGDQMRNEKEFAPKLNKYCISCDVLAGCPLEGEARRKAQESAESYQKLMEVVRETQAKDARAALD